MCVHACALSFSRIAMALDTEFEQKFQPIRTEMFHFFMVLEQIVT